MVTVVNKFENIPNGVDLGLHHPLSPAFAIGTLDVVVSALSPKSLVSSPDGDDGYLRKP